MAFRYHTAINRSGVRDVPQFLVRDLSTSAVSTLKALAKRNHRSLQREIKSILEDTATRVKVMERFRRDTEKLRASFGNRKFSNGVDIIRKMRDVQESFSTAC